MDRDHEELGHELLGDNWPDHWDLDYEDNELQEELEREAEYDREMAQDHILAQQELEDFEQADEYFGYYGDE